MGYQGNYFMDTTSSQDLDTIKSNEVNPLSCALSQRHSMRESPFVGRVCTRESTLKPAPIGLLIWCGS
jgi:hypothetical protein